MNCTECGEECVEYYVCEESELHLCTKCQKSYDMFRKCKKHFYIMEGVLRHDHIKFPRDAL